MAGSSSLFLYSTNPWVKLHVQRNYRGDIHYVWCGEHADSRAADPGSLSALTPPSSNPAEIYADLRQAVARTDTHNAKVRDVRDSYLGLTTKWVADGSMSDIQRDEVVAILRSGDMRIWRPVLYVIARHVVDSGRLKLVAPAMRAGFAPEYIIEDLRGDEFDAVELP